MIYTTDEARDPMSLARLVIAFLDTGVTVRWINCGRISFECSDEDNLTAFSRAMLAEGGGKPALRAAGMYVLGLRLLWWPPERGLCSLHIQRYFRHWPRRISAMHWWDSRNLT